MQAVSDGVWIVGETNSEDLPLKDALQNKYAGGRLDVFLTKLSLDGSELKYSTYFGGSAEDRVGPHAVHLRATPEICSSLVPPHQTIFRWTGRHETTAASMRSR